MIIVGELINATKKAVKEAVESKDGIAIRTLARAQAGADADYIDVNAGIFADDEADCLKWIIDRVVEAVPEVPVCIDSSTPKAVEAAVEYFREKTSLVPMINSVSLENERFEALLPIVAGSDLKIVALCIGSEGIPETSDQRVSAADALINRLVKNNVPLENIYVDPLVQSLGTNHDCGMALLTAVERIMTEFCGVHTICGLSNISFGLPARKFLNHVFISMAVSRGLDAAIVNPLDREIMAAIITAEALAGKDSYCTNYLKAYRAGQIAV